MKTVSIKTAEGGPILEQLKKGLGGTLEEETRELELLISNQFGEGYIKETTFKGGISHLMIDLEFNEDLEVEVDSPVTPPICFAYCWEGQLLIGHGEEGKKIKLENFQTGIFSGMAQKVLRLEKGINLKMILIVVDPLPHMQDENHLNRKLHQLFLKGYAEGNFAYVGSYNLRIAEKIQQLGSIPEKGIAKRFMIKGLVHMILALEIQQHRDDMGKNLANRASSLTGKEMESIRELSLFVNNYSEKPLSISYLCKKGGLSPSKLQEGFKLMHDTTVTNYIREVRIKKAEDLIKNTDLNISEVVYSIGLISRSYFSKIFKAKYNCSPKLYKEKQSAYAISS